MRFIGIDELMALDIKHKTNKDVNIISSTYGVDESGKALVTSRVIYSRPRAIATEPKAEHLIDEYCAFKYYDKTEGNE